MPTKKKHHYIPQFYIANFTNGEGNVFVLEHETGKINEQTKNGTFHKRKFYTMDLSKHEPRSPESTERMRKALGLENVDTSGVKEHPDMIEDLLAECEGMNAPVIKKLIAGENITASERVELSTFIAFMYTRNPAFHDFAATMEKRMTEEMMKDLFSSKEKLREAYDEVRKTKDVHEDKVSLDDLSKVVEEGRFEVTIPKELTIQAMLMCTNLIDRILYAKSWLILEASPDTSFITNDNPVFIDHPVVYQQGAFSAGFSTPGAKIIFPLSKECLLIMIDTARGAGIARKKIDKARVREYNKMIFAHSSNYVIGRDLALVERIKKSFVSGVK